jgi:hypothetical protein
MVKTIPKTKKQSFKREDKFIRKKIINKSISMWSKQRSEIRKI